MREGGVGLGGLKWRRDGCLQWWVGSWYVELQLQLWGRVSSNIQLQAATDNDGPLMSEDFWLAAASFLLLWKVFSVFYRRQINGRQLAAASVQRRSSTSMYTEYKVVVFVVVEVEALHGALPLGTQYTEDRSSSICSSCRSISSMWSSTLYSRRQRANSFHCIGVQNKKSDCIQCKATASNVKHKTTAVHCTVKSCAAQLI